LGVEPEELQEGSQLPCDDLWQDFVHDQNLPAAQQGDDTLITQQNTFGRLEQHQEHCAAEPKNGGDLQHHNTDHQSREEQSQPTHQQRQEPTHNIEDVCKFVMLILTIMVNYREIFGFYDDDLDLIPYLEPSKSLASPPYSPITPQ